MHEENPYASPETESRTRVFEGDSVLSMRRTVNWADLLRAYRIVVDGQEVARVSAGMSVDIPVTSGTHSIVVKIDWCSSPTLNFDIDSGQRVQFECGSNFPGLRVFLACFYGIFLRDQYLVLKEI